MPYKFPTQISVPNYFSMQYLTPIVHSALAKWKKLARKNETLAEKVKKFDPYVILIIRELLL